MRILVTGTTGFVGKRLVNDLIDNNIHFTGLIRNTSPKDLPYDCISVQDLAHIDNWDDILSGYDIIIHLAARVHMMNETGKSLDDLYDSVNFLPVHKMASSALKVGVKKIIFMSTIKVFGESSPVGSFIDEKSKDNPDDSYSRSKLKAENALLELSKNSDMSVVIIRPPLVYGPGVKANFLKLLKIVSTFPILPFGSFKNKRSMVFVGNLSSAIIQSIKTESNIQGVYILADDEAPELRELLKLMAVTLKKKLILLNISAQLIERVLGLIGKKEVFKRIGGSYEVSNNKFKEHFNWSPPYTLKEAMLETCRGLEND